MLSSRKMAKERMPPAFGGVPMVTTFTYGTAGGCSSCSGGGVGKIVARTNPDNLTTSYTYDLGGHVTRIDFAGSSDYVEYTYDDAGRVESVTDTRVPSEDIGGQTFTYGYDLNDRMTTYTWPNLWTVSYGFDKLGRRTRMTDPDGNVTQYTYANQPDNKKLESIAHPFGGMYFGYNNLGRLTGEEYAGQVASYNIYGYDDLGRVSSIDSGNYINGGNFFDVRYHREDYTYNAASIRTRIDYQSDAPGFSPYYKTYKYDDAYRLTEEHKLEAGTNTSLYRYAYTYDRAGNRQQMVNYTGTTTNTVNYTYNDFNQLTQTAGSLGTTGYSFDANGNMNRTSESWTDKLYVHDRSNRLVQYENEKESLGVTYGYDTGGRRILRIGPDGTKVAYIFDGINVLMTKERGPEEETWRTKQVFTLKQADIGQIVAQRENTSWDANGGPIAWTDSNYHFDLLGNTTAISNNQGQLVEHYDMEAFGTILTGNQNGYHLTTKEWDAGAGLYYFNARWVYTNGLFLQSARRSIEIEHRYTFCRQDPLRWTDEDGEEPGEYANFDERLAMCSTTCHANAGPVGGGCHSYASNYCKCMADCMAGHGWGAEWRVRKKGGNFPSPFGTIWIPFHFQCEYSRDGKDWTVKDPNYGDVPWPYFPPGCDCDKIETGPPPTHGPYSK